jgi:hypothetical protein
MQPAILNPNGIESCRPSSPANPLEVHPVDTGDIFYKKGRVLAESVYRQIWNTEKLLDGNDYAVVVSRDRTVVGNLNLQSRSKHGLLKSEGFFGERHWETLSRVGPARGRRTFRPDRRERRGKRDPTTDLDDVGLGYTTTLSTGPHRAGGNGATRVLHPDVREKLAPSFLP